MTLCYHHANRKKTLEIILHIGMETYVGPALEDARGTKLIGSVVVEVGRLQDIKDTGI